MKAALFVALGLLGCNTRTTAPKTEGEAPTALGLATEAPSVSRQAGAPKDAAASPAAEACAARGGRIVTAKGVAKDAKGGAVLLDGDGVVYVKGLDAWPRESIDRDQSIEGCLAEEKYLPVATRDPSGIISQGVEGDGVVWVLERGR